MTAKLDNLGYARVFRHPRTGELVVDTDSLRRPGNFSGVDFGAEPDDDEDDDEDGDDEDLDEDDEDDEDEDDEPEPTGWWASQDGVDVHYPDAESAEEAAREYITNCAFDAAHGSTRLHRATRGPMRR